MKHLLRNDTLPAFLLGLSALAMPLGSVHAQTDSYNIKIGNLLMDFSMNVGYAYNDNVTAVSKNTPDLIDPTIIGPRADYIFSYGFDVGINWQITDNNTLGVVLGMKNEDYRELNYMDSNRTFFTVNPDSMVDFTVLLGFLEARVYNKFGYTVDGSNSVFVTAADTDQVVGGDGREIIRGRSVATRVDRYAAWTNEIGLELLAILNPLEVTLRVSRYDLMPDDNDELEFVQQLDGTFQRPKDRWEFTRRSELIVFGQVYYPLGRENGVGVFGRYTDNDYKRDLLADSTGWQIGVTGDWGIGERTALSASVGFDFRDYDERNTLRFLEDGSFADITSGQNLFYSISLLNLLGESFNHKFSFSRVVSYGRVTNEQVSDIFAWDFLYEGLRRIDVIGGVQWVTAKDSGPALYAENYDLLMATLGFEVELGNHLSTKLDLRHVNKDSNDNDRDFVQNSASLSLRYDF
jgi:hypothetical protein